MQKANLSRRTLLALAAGSPLAAEDWSGFRGDGASVAHHRELPLRWSADDGVAWVRQLPGTGQSSPVLWEGRVFVTSLSGPNKEMLYTSALNLSSGEIVWTNESAPDSPQEVTNTVSQAAPTPVADATGVYAFFETGNLEACSHDGDLRWSRGLNGVFGEYGGRHGFGSSLSLCLRGVLVLAAHDGPSCLLCVDRQTGETLWKAERESGISWSTPLVMHSQGRELAVVSGGKRVDAYDTATGEHLWQIGDVDGAFIPSPTPTVDGVVIGSSAKGQTRRLRFREDPTHAPEEVWRAPDGGSYFSSPLVVGDYCLMVNKAGVLYVLNLADGSNAHVQRLATGACWASPIAVGKRVYLFGESGVTQVMELREGFPIVAENALAFGEERVYGVAVAGDGFIVRYGDRVCKLA